MIGFGQDESDSGGVPASDELGEAACGGVQRHHHQKHGESRGEPLGTHPCGEATSEQAADNRGEGEQPMRVQSRWTP